MAKSKGKIADGQMPFAEKSFYDEDKSFEVF